MRIVESNDLAVLRAELAAIKALLMPDGFEGVGPGVVVFCNTVAGNKEGWYTLDAAGQPVTMPSAFYGLVDWIRCFEHREEWKFRLHMKTRSGQKYYFESGLRAYFAKTAITALAQANPDHLKHLVKIKSWVKEIEQGKNSGRKTLACGFSLPAFDYKLESQWSNESNFNELFRQADANVQAAVGRVREGDFSSYQ